MRRKSGDDTLDLGPLPGTLDLVDGARACYRCGVGVIGGETRTLTAYTKDGVPNPTKGAAQSQRDFEFGLCLTCGQRTAQAHKIAGQFPNVVASIGAANVAEPRIVAVLDACASLGVKVPATEREWRRALRHMVSPSASARWAFQFTPHWFKGTDPKACATAPWTHVLPEVREALWEAHGEYLADLTDIPRPVPPPAPHVACSCCGVDHVIALRRTRADVWETVRIQSPEFGTTGVEELVFFPPCFAAMQAFGGIGRGGLERALLDHAGWVQGYQPPPYLPTLRPWRATGRKPSKERFAWLNREDVEALRQA